MKGRPGNAFSNEVTLIICRRIVTSVHDAQTQVATMA
jgi:hypothetical protein